MQHGEGASKQQFWKGDNLVPSEEDYPYCVFPQCEAQFGYSNVIGWCDIYDT